MAFVKKFSKSTKKEAPKAAASYARKKREEEVEEIEEVEEVEEVEAQEEVADDYDEQEDADTAPAPAPRRSAQAPRQAPPRPSYGQSQGQGEQKKALRLTGLFAGKREGCFSGKLRAEDAENLAALIQEATAINQQVVFFLWENQGNPQFSLTANISAPFKGGGFNKGGNGGFNRGNSGGQGGFRKRW